MITGEREEVSQLHIIYRFEIKKKKKFIRIWGIKRKNWEDNYIPNN